MKYRSRDITFRFHGNEIMPQTPSIPASPLSEPVIVRYRLHFDDNIPW